MSDDYDAHMIELAKQRGAVLVRTPDGYRRAFLCGWSLRDHTARIRYATTTTARRVRQSDVLLNEAAA